MVYTEEFRKQALELVEQIGVPKASKQLHVGEMTLRTWRKKAGMVSEQKSKNMDFLPMSNETQTEAKPMTLQLDFQRELEEQIRLNRSCQQTIEYLVDENTALRRQCDQYLKAIALISQK